MRRKIVALCILLAFISGAFSFVRTGADELERYEADGIYKLSSPSVFYLRNIGEYNTVRSVGTGVFISKDGLALTAYHVVKNMVQLEALMADGSTIAGIKVEAYDENKDIALLRFPKLTKREQYTALPIRQGKLKQGETVFAIGFPLKETPIITQGIINSPDAEINGNKRILTSAQIVSGMSGGPVIDRLGNMVGIISGSLRTMDGIHLIVSMGDAQTLIESTLINP